MSTRSDLRNLAIVAHVDHGKTTLVDALLRQSGAFRANEALTDRVMDSTDLEREKGITILAKNTSVVWDGVTLNIVDTPGHADFGGEVERALTMVDGIVLLVDAAEGPLPQTRFVLRKALADDLPVILVINKVDRPDARIASRRRRGLRAVHGPRRQGPPARLPDRVLLGPRRLGHARPRRRRAPTSAPLCDVVLEHIPAPTYTEGASAPGVGHQPRRQPVPRPAGAVPGVRGHDPQGPAGRLVPRRRHDPAGQGRRAVPHQAPRRECRSTRPRQGDLVAVAGIEDITIGETLADPDDPRPLPVITVDEPALSMTIGINTSPLAGRDGTKLTARLVKNRLDAELVGNVSIRMSTRPIVPTRGRCRRVASCSWRCSSRRCAARGSSSRSASPRSCTTRDRRHGLRAGRAGHDRRARGAPRRGHPAARHPQGPDGEHGQPRPRLGAARLPRAGSRPDRVPHRVPHRDPRHGRAQPHLRGLRAVGRRDPCPRSRFARRRPSGPHHHLRDGQPAGPLDDDGRPGHRGVLRDDRRRELARRRHGRQHLP